MDTETSRKLSGVFEKLSNWIDPYKPYTVTNQKTQEEYQEKERENLIELHETMVDLSQHLDSLSKGEL